MSHSDKPLEIDIQPISRHLDLGSFDCGASALNDYLRKYARQNHDRNISKTFVAMEKGGAGSRLEPAQPGRVSRHETSAQGDRKVLGFYTLVASEIDAKTIPTTHSKNLPRYPVPAVRIGRLAVDKHHQGQGIGEDLLWDALDKANRLSEEVGIYAVVVDAKDEKAVQFYHKYGFVPLSNNPKTLFLPVETVKVLFTKK
ncbi:MAG TPA: GNAT family N-acetyltransferase [bacterium]